MHESQVVDDQAYQEALEFLYGRINYERMASGSSRFPFRLRRTNQLLQQLGLGGYLHQQTSQPKVPIVHIAGTKGKGSTANMVAAALSASGLRTGLYTSPHLHRLEERFQIDGQPCAKSELVELVAQVQPHTESIPTNHRSPSFFELITAIALLHFDRSDCEAIVLEVGLGGRLDSTNVCAPSVTVITSIGLDHQHILGHSLAEIAGEKAGICKSGVPLVSGVATRPAADVIDAKAAHVSAPLWKLGRDFSCTHDPREVWGSTVHYQGATSPLRKEMTFPLQLEGVQQAQNAALALTVVDLLRADGLHLDPAACVSGISTAQCPGRLERFDLPDDVLAVVDSAHNIDSVDALCDCLGRRAAGREITLVFGTSQDKDAPAMLSRLADVADHLVLTRFVGNPRSTPPEDLCDLVGNSGGRNVDVYHHPVEACQAALRMASPGGMLVVCGSFFLAAETRAWFAGKAIDDAPAKAFDDVPARENHQ